jgi:hypothetical protein
MRSPNAGLGAPTADAPFRIGRTHEWTGVATFRVWVLGPRSRGEWERRRTVSVESSRALRGRTWRL